MRKHVAGTVLEVAVALRRVVLEKLQDQIRRVFVERRPADRGGSRADLLVEHDVARVRLVEGREPREHLEDEHSQRVPVNRLVVPLVADDLRSRERVRAVLIESYRTSGAR